MEGFKINVFAGFDDELTVPHSGSGVAPMSSLSGAELLGSWGGLGMGRLIGWREGQMGSVYKKPDKREDSLSQLEGAK